jgi:hypothetical protein
MDSIIEDGKRHKLLYFEDGRYGLALSKTGCDWRGWENAAPTVSKNMI